MSDEWSLITLLSLFDRRWRCNVARSGFHNGARCAPDDAHGENWRCGWRYEASLTEAHWLAWEKKAVQEARDGA